MKMVEINERLKDILSLNTKKIVKDKDVAIALGIDPNTYANMKFRDSIPYKEIMDFLYKNDISINLFFYSQDSKKLIRNDDKYKILKLFNANASLGGGVFNEDVAYKEVFFDKEILKKIGGNEFLNIDIINGMGESMEPTIYENDLCFVTESSFKNGGLFAINTPDGLFIKEVYNQDGIFVLVSHNPAYTPIRFIVSECHIIGRVFAVCRKIK